MVTIRQAMEEDYSKIVDFHNRHYSSNRTLEQFYWEFHDSPFGPSIYYIAEDKDRIIATNSFIPIELINDKKEIFISAKSEDSLLDPHYWGQPIFYNLFAELLKKAEREGYCAVWGFTPARKAFKRLGFSIPFKHSQSLIVKNILSSYGYLANLNKNNKLTDKAKILGLCTLSRLNSVANGKERLIGDYSVSREDTIDNISELINLNLQKQENLFSIHHTPDYVKWRIYENPNYFRTHTFAFKDSGKNLIGYVIYNSHPNRVAYIINSIFHPDLDNKEIQSMIRYTASEVFKEGVDLIRNWHFHHNSINTSDAENFRKAGFTLLDRGIEFVWKEIKPSGLTPSTFLLSRMATQGVI